MSQSTAVTVAQPQTETPTEKAVATRPINVNPTSKASTLPCTQEDKTTTLEPNYDLLPKIKPKGACTSFIHYSSEMLKKSNSEFGLPDETKHVEKVKVISTKWKELTEDQKQPYQQLAVEDKQRWLREMEQFKNDGFFVNVAGVKSTDILPELKDFPKETVFPKKILSTFMIFLGQFDHSKFKEENGSVTMAEACKHRAEKYAQITEEERAVLQKQSDVDRERYEKEVHQLRSIGYFVNKEGTKSTDLKRKRGKAEREADKKEKEKEKEKMASNEERETVGWSFYYQQNFEKTWHQAEGKTEKTKKDNVDGILQQKWLDMSETMKKKTINAATKAKNGEPVTLGKRKKPDNESTSTSTATVKKQKN